MVLVIGGAYQGKYKVALELYRKKSRNKDLERISVLDGTHAIQKSQGISEISSLENIDIWNHFHTYVKQMLAQGKTRTDMLEQLENIGNNNPNLIIICNEVGSGIVPMEKEERIYREEVGRICCILAQKATDVIRVVCGIGTEIKHEQ